MDKIKIAVLGSNGWYTTNTGNTTCIFMETSNFYIILDAGNGIYKIDDLINDEEKPIYLFISHFHLDHISGLHILNKFKSFKKITICCFKGGKKYLKQIVTQPFTVGFKDLPMKIDIVEIDEGISNIFPFKLESKELVHSTKCFGYRFEIDDKIISYRTDTGFCNNALDLSKNADVILAECAYKHGQLDGSWPHLNPEIAADLARKSNAKKLVLIHFDSENYLSINERKKAEKYAREIFKNTIASQDDLEIEI